MSYFDYAGRIYGAKYNLLANAWEHSLTVDPSEISEDSDISSQRGKAQYPNGETEGVIIPQGVTSIGGWAFFDWESNNQPLVIPNSVTSIGGIAFSDWTSNNQPLIIPNSVTSIGYASFANWNSNKHPLVIPESVTSIGASAFGYWQLVPYVEIQAITPPTLASSIAFSGQGDAPIYVPDESVDDYKKATNWVNLASRIFPISDRTQEGGGGGIPEAPIDDKLYGRKNAAWSEIISGGGGEVDLNEMAYFNYAGNIYGSKYSLLENAWEHSFTVDPSEISADGALFTYRGKAQYPNGETEGVIIPQGVTSIGDRAFYGWESNDQPLVIPNSVTSIGDYAFADWNANNQPLVIPNSVTSIGNSAFDGWTSNNQPLVIPNSVTSIDNWAFYNWISNNHPLVIPESVTNIGNSAFRYWTSNNQPLVIPNSITSIGDFAFCNWKSNNQPLVIPDSITSIGEYAFWDWASNNQPLVIPNSVTSIGKGAFSNWQSVPYVEIHATTPPSLANANAFNGQNDAPIYVPDESVDDYKEATQWVNLASRIFPISDKGNTYTKGEIDLMIGDIENALDAILGV